MIKLRNKLVYSLPVLALFSYYSFFRIGTFNFTISFLVSILVIFLSFILVFFKQDSFSKIGLMAGLLIFLGMVFSQIFNGLSLINDNLWASFQLLFYIILFLCSTTKRNHLKIIGLFKIGLSFCHIVSIAAILGLLQFVYQLKTGIFLSFNISLFESVGYNSRAFNYSINLYRSNSIFLEPSLLSIYSAILFLFSFELLKNKKISKVTFCYFIICSLIGLMVSLSGSGLLMIVCVFILKFLFFNHCCSSKEKKIVLIGAICAITFFLATFNNTFFYKAIWSRLSEIFNHSSSASIRFILPLVVSLKSLLSNPFGIGCGETKIAIALFWDKDVSDVNDTYAKILIDLGIFGLLFLINVIHSIIKKVKGNKSLITVVLIFLIFNITGSFISSVEFWVTLALLLNFTSEKYKVCFQRKGIINLAQPQLIRQNI